MENESYKNSRVFLFALGIMTFLYGLKQIYVFSDNRIIETINDFVQVVSILLLICIVLKKTVESRWLKYLALLGILILVGLKKSGSIGILRLYLVILASKGISYKRILNMLLKVFISVFMISMVLFALGISAPSTGKGWSLGFIHPNIAALFITTILFLRICLKKKLNYKSKLAFLLAAVLIIVVIGARVAAICVALFPLIHKAVCAGCEKKNKMIRKITCYSQVIMCAISVLLVVIYPMKIYNPIRTPIDEILSYRPYYNFNNIMEYGVNIWGRKIDLLNTSEYAYNYYLGFLSNLRYNTVDNAYIMGLITGIIPLLIKMICFILVQKKAWSRGNTILLTIGIIYALYAFIENGANEMFIVFPYYYLLALDDNAIAETEAICSDQFEQVQRE